MQNFDNTESKFKKAQELVFKLNKELSKCRQYNINKYLPDSPLFLAITIGERFDIKQSYATLVIHAVPYIKNEDKVIEPNTITSISEEISVVLRKEEFLAIVRRGVLNLLFDDSAVIKTKIPKQRVYYLALLCLAEKIEKEKNSLAIELLHKAFTKK